MMLKHIDKCLCDFWLMLTASSCDRSNRRVMLQPKDIRPRFKGRWGYTYPTPSIKLFQHCHRCLQIAPFYIWILIIFLNRWPGSPTGGGYSSARCILEPFKFYCSCPKGVRGSALGVCINICSTVYANLQCCNYWVGSVGWAGQSNFEWSYIICNVNMACYEHAIIHLDDSMLFGQVR